MAEDLSVDAVRFALSNISSKTTIYKYLRELQEEEGIDRKSSIREVFHNLVERLAGQPQAEVNQKLEAACSKHQEQAHAQAELNAELRTEVAAVTVNLPRPHHTLAQNQVIHASTRKTLKHLTVKHRAAE